MEEMNTSLKEVRLKNGTNLSIRKAAPSDAERIIAYMNVVGGESDNLSFGAGELNTTVQQETDLIENLHKDGRSIMLLGIIGDEIACVSALKCFERKRVRHNAEFSITVRKKYWGIGVANAVMPELFGYAKARGDIKNINLGVRVGNDKAISIYEKYGFVKIGVQKDFFYFGDTYCDVLLMDLYL